MTPLLPRGSQGYARCAATVRNKHEMGRSQFAGCNLSTSRDVVEVHGVRDRSDGRLFDVRCCAHGRKEPWLRPLAGVLSTTLAILACRGSTPEPPTACEPLPDYVPEVNARPFGMGFNRWPPDLTAEAAGEMYAFIGDHADLLLHHLDSGVPWPEALRDEQYSAHLMQDWTSSREATPASHQVFVAITPINDQRDGIAKYRGEEDNLPPPDPWGSYPLNHPEVKQAYLNYARRTVEFFEPDYLAIGIEVNLLLLHAPELWDGYLELHQETYRELKRSYPDLAVFATFTMPHLRGELDDADPDQQQAAVGALMPYSDLVGLSAYPYNWIYETERRVPQDYFAPALQYGKPIAVAETGMPTEDFTAFLVPFDFEVSDQTNYIELLLQTATELEFEFVVNWAGIDFDRMLERFPPGVRDLASYWAYTGLQRSDGCPKPALSIWDAYLALPRR